MTFDRVPPQAVEVEKHVLGAMMLDQDAVSIAAAILKGPDFYLTKHQVIFEAIIGLAEKNQAVDALTVSESLKASGKFEMAGGDSALMEIAVEVVSSASVSDHARIVKDKSLKRRHIALASWLSESAYGERPGNEIQADLERQAFDLHDRSRSETGLRPIREVLADSFTAIAKMQAGAIVGLPTGLKTVDAYMGGMNRGDLIVLAGRPGQGKTSLGAQIGIHAAKTGAVVPFFECEMKDRAVVDRALFGEAGISHQLFKHGKVPENRWPEIARASEVLRDIPFFINDSAGITPMQIRSQCRRLKREMGRLDVIAIDNIQRMKSDSGTSDVRVRTGEVSSALKEIAKEFDVPVLAISHLRRLQSGEGTEPTLADLQESGNIEQDADIVMSLFNKSLYCDVPDQEEGKVKLTFLKYREGSLGYVDLYFQKELTKFLDWSDRPTPTYSTFMQGVEK